MGDAEAEAMTSKAAAWKQYTSGAYMEMLINKLPLMAAQVATEGAPLSRPSIRRRAPRHSWLAHALGGAGGCSVVALVCAQVADPLSQAKDVTFVSTGGEDIGASRLTGEVVRVMGQVPPMIHSLTGINMAETLRQLQPPRVA